jgi:hypothetical protein
MKNIKQNIGDFLFSRFKQYRKNVGGIWRHIHIIENVKWSHFAECTYEGWVREEFQTSKRYWHDKIEAYGQSFYEKAKTFKSFEYILE